MQKAQYDTDLTAAQWQLLEPLLPKPKRLGRPRTPLREIVNALLYAVKTGCGRGCVNRRANRPRGANASCWWTSWDWCWPCVCPATTPERAGARESLVPVLPYFQWLRKLWVDGSYSGPEFAALKESRPKLDVEVIKRSDAISGFTVFPKRWVVERTLGWFMQHRRLVRDYEQHETSATGWIFIARLRLMLRRLA